MPQVDLPSSSLKAARYQDQCALLDLEFQSGEIYRYHDIPVQVYHELLQAESKGRYFNQHIRNHFPYTKIDPARGSTDANSTPS
jgi:hypothetical protein